ncbi:TonB-dependent receptor [Pseudobowmanella zhangzhouensis]|uniref:TonB-dependent receptor n=1 Tax=Pseudobowmanella zhangzhouensis TaxID=1537679 RepID=UPI003607CAC2
MQKTLLASGVLLAMSAMADDNIETIQVTADYTVQNLQTMAASVSIVDNQQIEQRQARHIEQILNIAANVNFNSGASRGRFVQIRGIGERSQYAEPINPSVGLLVDDVDMSGLGGAATLFDVAQVEILRGPQSSNTGAAALAGMVKITTTAADANQTSLLTATAAGKDTFNLGLAHGGALTDKLFYRFAAQQFQSDGFVYNQYLDRHDTNGLDELTSRLKLRYLATEQLTLDMGLHFFDVDNGYDAFSLDNDGVTRSDEPGFDRQQTRAVDLKARWQQPWGEVLTIVTHSNTHTAYGYDEDWTYVGFHPWEYQSTDHYSRQRQQSTLDVRVSSLTTAQNAWVVSVYWSDADESAQRQYTYSEQDYASTYQPSNLAVYGQQQWQLSDSWQLTGALRYDHYQLTFNDNSGFTAKVSDSMLGGKLVLDMTLPSGMWYAGIFRGYKAGGFNPDENVSEAKRYFAPEYNWNLEVGVKGRFADDAGFFRLAVFSMQRQDTQIADYDVQQRGDGTAEFFDVIANADNGFNNGLELETGYQVNDDLYLAASVGLLNAQYGNYTTARGDYIAERQQAQAPDYTYHVGMRYQLTDALSLYLDADGKADYYFSDGHNEQAKRLLLVNANLRWQQEGYSVSLWASNLTDQTYYTRGFGGFSNDPRDFYETPEPYYQLGNGRQFGVTLDYQF